jgi:hypothetical protein
MGDFVGLQRFDRPVNDVEPLQTKPAER